ncbi:MAG: BCAM0308 family protein [Myxococcota bacterium]
MTHANPPRTPRSDARRDRLIGKGNAEPYRSERKLPDPTTCADCGALYRNGRWVWGDAPEDAHRALCPACHRIRDAYPAGVLTISGSFIEAHRAEILGLARNVESREKGDHPLKRIMAVRSDEAAVTIETTEAGLARNIGDALHRAYEGDLDYTYGEGGDLLRVTWKR